MDTENTKLKPSRIVICVIIAAVVIGVGIFGIVSGIYGSGANFDNWTQYSLDGSAVTIRIPSARRVHEASERDPDMPGLTMLSADSGARAAAVTIIANRGIYAYIFDDLGMNPQYTSDWEFDVIAELSEELFLLTLVSDHRWIITHSSSGITNGVRYQQMRGTFDGNPGAIRSFSVGNDIYMVLIVTRTGNASLIDSFLASIVVG